MRTATSLTESATGDLLRANLYPAEIEATCLPCPGCTTAPSSASRMRNSARLCAPTSSRSPAQFWMRAGLLLLRARLAGFKMLGHSFRDELAARDSGKIMKRKLRDPYWEGSGHRVWRQFRPDWRGSYGALAGSVVSPAPRNAPRSAHREAVDRHHVLRAGRERDDAVHLGAQCHIAAGCADRRPDLDPVAVDDRDVHEQVERRRRLRRGQARARPAPRRGCRCNCRGTRCSRAARSASGRRRRTECRGCRRRCLRSGSGSAAAGW